MQLFRSALRGEMEVMAFAEGFCAFGVFSCFHSKRVLGMLQEHLCHCAVLHVKVVEKPRVTLGAILCDFHLE